MTTRQEKFEQEKDDRITQNTSLILSMLSTVFPKEKAKSLTAIIMLDTLLEPHMVANIIETYKKPKAIKESIKRNVLKKQKAIANSKQTLTMKSRGEWNHQWVDLHGTNLKWEIHFFDSEYWKK